MENTDKWLRDMVDKELAATANSWIKRAVEQKNPRMTLGLAHSVLLRYSEIDKFLLQCQTLN